MRLLITSFFLFYSGYQHLLAQQDKIQVSESRITYFKNIIDSLSLFMQSGRAVITNSECLLPEHKLITVSQPYSRFPKLALDLNENQKKEYIKMYAFYDEGSSVKSNQNSADHLLYFQKALDIAVKNKFDYEELHNWRVSLNNVFFHEGDYQKAMSISTEGLAKAERIKDLERMAHYNNVLGYIMMRQQNFESSEKYFIAHLQLAKQIRNRDEEAKALLNLADLSLSEKKIELAVSFINEALHIYQTYKPEDKAKQAYTFNKLAEAYRLMQKNMEALKYVLLAIQLVKQTGGHNQYDIATYYINAGFGYNLQKRTDSALYYANHGLAMAQEIKHRELMRNAYEQLSFSFAEKKRFDSAYIYQQLFSKLKDSILNENSQKEILQRETSLQIESQKKIQEAAISRQQMLRNIIIGIAVLIITVLILLYNRRRIKQKMLYQQQLSKQQIEQINAVINAQDRERKRIAEDLHDSVGSILSAAKMKLSVIAETTFGNGTNESNTCSDTLNLIDEAVNEMRNISHNLLPASLIRIGLVAGLKNLFDKISSASGLQISFNVHGFKERIDETVEVSIYRIILEAINNIVKHSKASNATVQLMQFENYINILVEDDGVGFDRNSIQNKPGIGLNSIISRVNHIKGNIDIDTRPNTGTIINIDIPYKAQ